MFKKLRNIAIKNIANAVIYRIVRVYCSTLRIKVINESPWINHLEQGGRVLLCAWHQQFFSVIRNFKKYEKYHPSLMISKSLDGEIIAGVAKRSGWHTVRGSSSRDGGIALKEMTARLKQYGLAGHILDGPRGPAGVVKPGIISLAHSGEAVIVPVFVESEKAWYFNSWDRFMVPKPFSRVTINFCDIIKIQPLKNDKDFEEQRLMLESILKPHLKL
jgi:hypothetical protein